MKVGEVSFNSDAFPEEGFEATLVQTNDPNFAQITTIPIANDETIHVRIIGIADRSDHATSGSWRLNATFHKPGGTLAEISVTELAKHENNGLDFRVVASGGAISIEGKGKAGETHTWKIWARIWNFTA